MEEFKNRSFIFKFGEKGVVQLTGEDLKSLTSQVPGANMIKDLTRDL
jgi:hypothetical protein